MVLRLNSRRNTPVTWCPVPEYTSRTGRAVRISAMEQLIVISAVGGDPSAIVHGLARVILDCGGNIKESRMTSLGSDFGMLLLAAGNWHTISRLERELDKFAEQNKLTMQFKRTDPRRLGKELLPYAVDVVGLDQPGVVHNLSGFFVTRNVQIGEVSTRSYTASHTGAPMFSVQMFINIPSTVHIAALREEFMELCDQLNVDAIMEPVKQS